MKKSIAILIVVLTVALTACCLFACNDKGGTKSERELATDDFKNGFMSACYDGWRYSMTDSEIKALPNEAHYRWQKGLTDAYANALYSSSVRVQKIKSLADELKTNDELKRILRSEKFDSGKFVAVFDNIGFTGADYASVATEVLKEWIKNGYSLTEKKIKELVTRRDNLSVTVSSDKVTEFNEVIGDLQVLQNGLLVVNEQKDEIVSSVNASQKDFQTIIEFVVDMRSSLDIKSILGFENDVKFDDLSSKTVDEIYTYVKSIIGAVSSFSEKLTAEKIQSLGDSLEKLENAFKDIYTNDSVLSLVVRFVSVSNTLIDYVPLAKYLISPVSGCVDKALTECVVSVLYGDYPTENYAFVVGKILKALNESLSQTEIENKIGALASDIKGDVAKIGYAWYAIGSVLGEAGFKFGGNVDDIVSTDKQKTLSSLMLFSLVRQNYFSNVIAFDLRAKLNSSIKVTDAITTEITWLKRVKEYVLDDAINKNKVGRELLKKCDELVDEGGNPTVKTVYEWAKTIVSAADLAFADIANTANEWIGETLKFLTKEFFEAKADNGQTMKSIYDKICYLFNEVNMKPLKETDAKFAELQELYKKANVEFILKFVGILK